MKGDKKNNVFYSFHWRPSTATFWQVFACAYQNPHSEVIYKVLIWLITQAFSNDMIIVCVTKLLFVLLCFHIEKHSLNLFKAHIIILHIFWHHYFLFIFIFHVNYVYFYGILIMLFEYVCFLSCIIDFILDIYWPK